MPYIHLQTNKPLSAKQREAIKSRMGAIIDIIPEKSEAVLMLNLEGDLNMFFSGKEKDCCYMAVKLHHKAPEQNKTQLVEKLFGIVAQELALRHEDIFITVEEHERLGANGRYLS
jgi:phenylpyruvate tautomerase PptA (4-oxalocrotonate tautomerase family)